MKLRYLLCGAVLLSGWSLGISAAIDTQHANLTAPPKAVPLQTQPTPTPTPTPTPRPTPTPTPPPPPPYDPPQPGGGSTK